MVEMEQAERMVVAADHSQCVRVADSLAARMMQQEERGTIAVYLQYRRKPEGRECLEMAVADPVWEDRQMEDDSQRMEVEQVRGAPGYAAGGAANDGAFGCGGAG